MIARVVLTTCTWVTAYLAEWLQLMSDLSLGTALIQFWHIALKLNVVMPIISSIVPLDHEGSAMVSVCMIACFGVAL